MIELLYYGRVCLIELVNPKILSLANFATSGKIPPVFAWTGGVILPESKCIDLAWVYCFASSRLKHFCRPISGMIEQNLKAVALGCLNIAIKHEWKSASEQAGKCFSKFVARGCSLCMKNPDLLLIQ